MGPIAIPMVVGLSRYSEVKQKMYACKINFYLKEQICERPKPQSPTEISQVRELQV